MAMFVGVLLIGVSVIDLAEAKLFLGDFSRSGGYCSIIRVVDTHLIVSVRELSESLESVSIGGLNPLTLL
jgi:hypothetical protein